MPESPAHDHPAGVEVIVHGGRVFAYLVRASANSDRTRFLTTDDLDFQLGMIVYKEGEGVIPHFHRPVNRITAGTMEAVMVRSGQCDVDLYDENQARIASRTMKPGDLVLLVHGGHGFRMSKDTVLLEVKQGPYMGGDEKVRFRDPGQ
jgi:hypothetical protein